LEYSIKHNASKSVEGKVEYGYLKRLIDEKKKEFDINCRISTKSIMNCTHRGTLTSHLGPGPKSLMEEVELALIEICIQMGKICQPLSCTKAIVLMNCMIENTHTQQKLIDFHQNRRLGMEVFKKGKVTSGW
jgi:hypothetical protein